MKNLKFTLAFLSVLFFSSCFDTEEKIVFNANHSGTYTMSIDLGRVLKMAGSMGENRHDPNKIKEKKDTTVYLKDLINTADNLTQEEKILYKDAVINLHLDEEKSEMMIVMSSPFKSPAALTEIKNNFSAVMNKLKAFEKATGETDKPEGREDDMKMGAKSTNPVGDQFTFKAVPGKISNSIADMDAFKKLVTSDSTLSMMSQMSTMMGEFNYKTVIILPKAVKKSEGPNSIVSGDKKTITFSTTLTEMMEHPEKVSYNVEY